ncbi:hypothetical protein TNCV_1504751 [Trichonephila clavipes]|uniref:Uncharacterized protein n=1 Tax=Trichonephila clavipes TaxID=2585209 RepID=A0A8X6RU85_TRICX|nr:hypothetical protein TNCV_1504751 [Trichonephila clavipes]
MAEKEVGEVKMAGERRVRENKRVGQKTTRVPRDCDTRTHLKKAMQILTSSHHFTETAQGKRHPRDVLLTSPLGIGRKP